MFLGDTVPSGSRRSLVRESRGWAIAFSWEFQCSRGLSLAEQSRPGPGGGGLRGGASAQKARIRKGGLWHWPGAGTWLVWEQEAHSMTLGFNGPNANPGLSLRSVYDVTHDIP